MTVERVDGFVLSGGSAFGLDAAGGAMAYLASHRARLSGARGLGADRAGREPVRSPQRRRQGLGPSRPTGSWAVARRRGRAAKFRARHRRRRVRRDHLRPQGRPRLGERHDLEGFASARSSPATPSGGRRAGASPHFWAAPFEREGEFGGLDPARRTAARREDAGEATSRPRRAQERRARQHQPRRRRHRRRADQSRRPSASRSWRTTGLALALRPAHAPTDGDTVFAAATGRAERDAGPPRPDRDRHARRRMRGARGRARRLRGDARSMSRARSRAGASSTGVAAA